MHQCKLAQFVPMPKDQCNAKTNERATEQKRIRERIINHLRQAATLLSIFTAALDVRAASFFLSLQQLPSINQRILWIWQIWNSLNFVALLSIVRCFWHFVSHPPLLFLLCLIVFPPCASAEVLLNFVQFQVLCAFTFCTPQWIHLSHTPLKTQIYANDFFFVQLHAHSQRAQQFS